MMPVMGGIETCEALRKENKYQETIILFLSARAEDYSHLAAFEVGADDYVNKPIKPKMLNSKVNALLRRFIKSESKTGLTFGELVINFEEYNVFLKNKKISLPRKEFELLKLLASKPDKVFKRESIMQSVWGSDVIVGDRTIDVHIRKLREKLGDSYFSTIKGVGYKFESNTV
jgi:two-component system alkaline phosphatase synthesis response regulator PhoP